MSLPGVRSGSFLVFVLCLGFYITPAALGGLHDAMLSNFIATQDASSFNIASTATSAFILLSIAAVVLSIVGLDLSGTRIPAARAGGPAWSSALPSFGSPIRYLDELACPYRAKRWTARLYQARGESPWWKIASAVFVGAAMFYLLFPSLVVVITSFSDGTFLEFPPSRLSLKWYRSFFGDPSWTGAAWASIQIAIAVVSLSTVVGTLAAYRLNPSSPRLRSFLNMLILAPITFPSIVVGSAAYLGLLNLGLTGTETGIILTHSIGASAYVVVIVSACPSRISCFKHRAFIGGNFDANRVETASLHSVKTGGCPEGAAYCSPIFLAVRKACRSIFGTMSRASRSLRPPSRSMRSTWCSS